MNVMFKKIMKALFVLIGTLTGAGFASGQEIYLFFYQYGINGIWGIILSSILIGMVIYKVLIICEREEIKNYKAFLNVFLQDEKKLNICNTVITTFILITFYIMIAGFGAYFEQQFGINHLLGSILLSTICYFVFLKNVLGLIKLNQVVVPILIGSLLIIGMNIIEFKNIQNMSNYVITNTSWKWILDSILYNSYNTILLIPVIIAVRKFVKNQNERMILSIVTILIVIVLSFIIFFMLAKIDVNIESLEMPVVYVVSRISESFKYIYGFIILSSILTTSTSLGTSFLENVASDEKRYRRYALYICLSAVVISNIGFSNLVNVLYPIFGYIGLVQIIKIMIFAR